MPFSRNLSALASLSLAASILSLTGVAAAQPAPPAGDKPADAAPPPEPPIAPGPTPAPPPTANAPQVAPPPPPPDPRVQPSVSPSQAPVATDVQTAPPTTPLASDVTHMGDAMDTRLTWTFGDDDVTKATGEAFPLSPNASVGDRPQYRLFFDNLNSRFAGRENLTHFVVYKKMPGFIDGLTTEAALVLRVDLANLAAQTNNVNSSFYDAGSYLRLFYKTHKIDDKRDAGLDLVFFPLDTDRFRLGYLYDISWGGTAQYINQSIFPRIQGTAPGAKLQYTSDKFYVFAGFKTAQIVEVQKTVQSQDLDVTRVQQTNYGLLVGGGVDATDNFRLDVGGGYFQQGRFEQPDVLGARVYTFGASGRIVVHDHMPVPASVDFALYRNDPNNPMILFRQEQYVPGQTSWAVSLEGSRLEQNLKDFDVPGATALQGATAAALQGTVKSGFARLQVTGIYRDLAFVMRNQPGFIPFETMPRDAKLQPEMFFAAAGDYYVEKARLTPGLGVGVQLPSTFASSGTTIFGNDIGTTSVVRQQGNISNLPNGKARVPIVQARLSLKWDLSRIMAAVVWGQVIRDNNATRLESASDGTTFQRTFVSPNFIGFGLALQARF